MTPWKILIVDDEEGIHGITRMIFRDYEFEQRPIELISAMSSAEAQALLHQHPDIALILLDVVMETENAGLQLVEEIRQRFNNPDVRIILRTGHPGYAPEAQVIIDYDINDYMTKAELSASRLLTSVIVALRAYRDIQSARQDAQAAQTMAAATINAAAKVNATAPISAAADSRRTEPAITESSIVPQIAQVLKQQMTPALQQSQRLQKLELNPIAAATSKDLLAHQLRMHNSIELLLPEQRAVVEHPVSPSALLDNLQQTFLPQSRQEGWILDARLARELPDKISLDPYRLNLLLTTSVELALLQAQGADLRVSLLPGQPGELVIHTEQTEGQPLYPHSPWSLLLKERLQEICSQLQGRVVIRDDDGSICYRIRYTEQG